MAVSYNIQMKVNPSQAVGGIRTVEGALGRVKDRVLDLNKSLRQIFGFYAIKEAVTFVMGLADSYQELTNKLRVVTTSTANLNTVSRETFRIAQSTRSSWDGTITMYQRLSLAAKDLGESQKSILDFTEGLNRAVIISGATSQEARAGLTQLSQGMASGTLRGDELRSVLEQLPVVADVISKHLGITRGELRKFGTEGKITAKTILEAFREADADLKERFAKTVPTLGQAWEMLKNSATQFFGEVGQNSGTMQALSSAILFVSEHFDAFGKVVIAAGQVLAVYFAYVAVGKAIDAIKALGLAFGANPLAGFLLLIISGIALLRQFGDQIDTQRLVWTNVAGIYVTVGDELRALWVIVKELGGEIYDFVSGAWNELTSAFNTGLNGEGFELTFHNALMVVAAFIGATKQLFREVRDHGKEMFGSLGLAIAEKIIDALNVVLKAFGNFLNFVRRGIFDLANNTAGKQSQAMTVARASTAATLIAKDPTLRAAAKADADAAVDRGAFGPGIDSAANEKKWQAAFAASYKKRVQGIQEAIVTDAMTAVGLNPDGSDPRNGSYDLTLTNPLKGASGFAKEQWGEAKDAAIFAAKAEMARFESISQQGAAQRVQSEAGKYGELEGASGKFKPLVDDKAAKRAAAELAKLNRELDALIRKSNPMEAAQLNLANAEKFLSNPKVLAILEERGLTAGTVLTNYAETLKEELDPLGTWVTKTIEASSAIADSTLEMNNANEVLRVKNDLDQKGLQVTEAQLRYITQLVSLEAERARIFKIQQGILDDANGPMKTYKETLKAIFELEAKGAGNHGISHAQARLAQGAANSAYTASNDNAYNEFQKRQAQEDPFGTAVKNAWNDMQVTAADVAASIEAVFKKAFENINQALLSFISTGKMDWEMFYQGIVSLLNQLALKILEMRLMLLVNKYFESTSVVGAVAGAAGAGGASGAAAAGISSRIVSGGSGAGPASQYGAFGMLSGGGITQGASARTTTNSPQGTAGSASQKSVVAKIYTGDQRQALVDAIEDGHADVAIINAINRQESRLRRMNSKG